ncbi:MFS sugar transporter [Cadophora sp. DSE1049]|nr:MFS sugar transporter [Cadophora sp. DSE1049]
MFFLFGLRGKSLGVGLVRSVIFPAYVLFGYNNAVCGGLLNLPSWIETFPRIDTLTTTGALKKDNSRIQGTVVAICTLGCFFGALNCIWIGDRLGRKRTIMLGAFINIIGALLQSTSFSLPQLIVGRLTSGLGLGALTATAPNWQSECSGAQHLGSAVLLEGLFISMGLAFAGWINFGMSHTAGSISWRFPMALSALWSVFVLIAVPNMPESPHWLIKKDRISEAREVLAALGDVATESEHVETHVSEIRESIAITGQGRFSDIFHQSELQLFHRTCLAVTGQISKCATIFEQDLGLSPELSPETARILGAAVFTWQTICSPIGVLTVDRLGRRKLMMFAAFGMGICVAVIAGTSSQSRSTSCVIVAAAFIFIFSFFFPTGFLGLTFLYAAEISPVSVRVPITSISTGTAWLFNFLVAEVNPVGFATLGVYLFFPETSGLRLEEIDQIFLDSNNAFQTVAVSREISRGQAILGPSSDQKPQVGFVEGETVRHD